MMPPPVRYLVAPVGGLITVATMDAALARAAEWRDTTRSRAMALYQVVELHIITYPPPLPAPLRPATP